MAHWHGLAKLHMHHDYIQEIMDEVTMTLGEKLHAFSDQMCPTFATMELHREFNAHICRQTEDFAVSDGTAPSDSCRKGNARLPKSFNLNTYKLHFLGDYVATVCKYGTMDSYSTEPVHHLYVFQF